MTERLRRARPDEAERITALVHRSKGSWGYSPDLMRRFVDHLAITADDIRVHEVWVLEGGEGDILGVCQVRLSDPAVLEDLWVDPAAMTRGHGRRLWEHAVDLARQHGATALELTADPNARGFYERMGARFIGEAPSEAVAGRRLPHMRLDLV